MAELADIKQTVAEFTALTKSQLGAGDATAAEQTARAVVALAPRAPEGWQILGEVLSLAPGRRGEAAEAFKKALEFDPENKEAKGGRMALSARETAAPNKQDASPKIPEFLAASGKDALIADARSLEASQRWQDARLVWEKVLKLDPSDTWAWSQYGHLLSVHLQNFPEAEAAFRRAIEEDPTDDWAWGKLGIMIADFQGRVAEGQEMLREAIRLDPSEPYYRGWLGWSLYRQSENLQDAEAELELAVKLQPAYQWAYFHLGYVRYAMGNKAKQALAAYEKALELEPDDVASLFNMAVLYEEQFKRPGKARQFYEKLLEIEADHIPSHYKLAGLYEQDEATYETAKYHYQQILLVNPQDLAALRCLAYLYYEKLYAFEDALAVFEAAIALAPDDADLHYRYGCMLWYELEQNEKGIKHLEQATSLAPDVALGWASLGEALAAVRLDYEGAEACYRKALELEPDYVWVMAHYGELLCDHLGRAEEGRQLIVEALELDEEYAWGWIVLGRVESLNLGDHKAAEKAFLHAAALDTEEVRPLLELVMMYFERMHRPDLAEQYCAKLTEMVPESGLVWGLYAYSQRFVEGCSGLVRDMFEKAITLDADKHWILHSYAEHMLYDRGDIGEAEALLLRANKVPHDCATTHDDLGLIRLAQGEYDIARAFFEKALEEAPDSADCWRHYGRFLFLADGDPALVEESFDRAIEDQPLNFENHLFLAFYLRDCGDRQEEAEAAWARAAELAPVGLNLDQWAALQMQPLIMRQGIGPI